MGFALLSTTALWEIKLSITYKIAHINKQGVDLIIIPFDSTFGHKPKLEQNQILEYLQTYSASANLSGTVVPCWREGNSFAFVAPSELHPLLNFQSFADILRLINKQLTCP
jgi:hypothetical protein